MITNEIVKKRNKIREQSKSNRKQRKYYNKAKRFGKGTKKFQDKFERVISKSEFTSKNIFDEVGFVNANRTEDSEHWLNP